MVEPRGIYIFTDVPYRTYTISWEEKVDMSSWWTYSDDAAWLTAGSAAFDEFFWYSWVRLSTAGVETAVITQAQSWWGWKLDITQLWTLTSGDNVMIKFPVRWIKMTKSWSIVTLSITDWLNREWEWYQYYAHSRWTLSSPVQKNALYLWAYKAYNNSNVLKSWSNKTPTSNLTQQLSINYARANDGNSWSAGYDIMWFYQREYINALYMMKYWNPDSQSTVWLWYIGGSTTQNTWWTNSQINATYWSNWDGDRVKLFWLEDRWGASREWVGWVCCDGSKNLWTALSWFVWDVTTTSPYENTGVVLKYISNYYELSAIAWNNKWLFSPVNTAQNADYNTYYCDYSLWASSARLAVAGGSGNDGLQAWAFYLVWGSTSTTTSNCSRIMYL